MQRIASQLRAIPQSALQKKIRDLTERKPLNSNWPPTRPLGRVKPPPKLQHLNPGEEKGYLTPF